MDEPGEHPFDFDDLGREERVVRHREKANVPGKKEMILEVRTRIPKELTQESSAESCRLIRSAALQSDPAVTP